jgi:hypothetical protein
VNIYDDTKSHKAIGDIYLVTPDKNEAYDKAIALGDSMGETMVFEGFNDTPQVGGINVWSR